MLIACLSCLVPTVGILPRRMVHSGTYIDLIVAFCKNPIMWQSFELPGQRVFFGMLNLSVNLCENLSSEA